MKSNNLYTPFSVPSFLHGLLWIDLFVSPESMKIDVE